MDAAHALAHAVVSTPVAGSTVSSGSASSSDNPEYRNMVNAFMNGLHTRMFLGSFHVMNTRNQHSAIIIAVTSRSNFWDDERFGHHSLFDGLIRFATFGAQPASEPIFDGITWFGNLTGHVNHPNDVSIVTSGSRLIPLNAGVNQISQLLTAEQYFRNNSNDSINYRLFPGGVLPLNGLNSNAYTYSLLLHSGITHPTLEGRFPGWGHIVQEHYFGIRRVPVWMV